MAKRSVFVEMDVHKRNPGVTGLGSMSASALPPQPRAQLGAKMTIPDFSHQFVVQLKHNAACRARAQATISQRADGRWEGRCGNVERGTVYEGRTRGEVADKTDGHYNVVMRDWLERRQS